MSGRAGAVSALPSFLSPADPMGEEHYAGGAPGLLAFLVVVRVRRCGRALEGGWVGARGETISPPAAHSVFWDLYCAAPDRREACEHSSEAKAFQDYVSPRPRGWDQGSWAWAGACALRGSSGQVGQAVRSNLRLCSSTAPPAGPQEPETLRRPAPPLLPLL